MGPHSHANQNFIGKPSQVARLLFSGSRQEDAPQGQEGDPCDLDSNKIIPEGPPEPTYKSMSPRALFSHQNRHGLRLSGEVKSLDEADNLLKACCEEMGNFSRETWAQRGSLCEVWVDFVGPGVVLELRAPVAGGCSCARFVFCSCCHAA